MTRATDECAKDTRETWARELLDHLRPAARDVGRVVDWLAQGVHGQATLQDTEGGLLAGTPIPLDADLVADIAAGRIASAAWELDGRHQRIVRVGPPQAAEAGVLAVCRTSPFDRRATDMVTRTAHVLEVLLRVRESDTAGRRLERATADLRLAILQLLMVQDVFSARRVAAGLWPGLLDAETACLLVLETTHEDRERLARECLDATAERALVVLCPAVDRHVIVLAPDQAVADVLRALAENRPGTCLGGSARQPLARTATAYGQAVSALAVARFRPGNTAVYAERTHPELLIDPGLLHRWTLALLRPLDGLAHHTHGELLATTRLGLEFTAVAAAKVLGVSRNTVRARTERVEQLLGADFSDLTVRALVHLALNTQAAMEETPPAGEHRPVALDEMLGGPALRAWAEELLGRLDADARDLRGTLRAWIGAGGNAERAAQELGVHPQTVRDHVRRAEPVLERQLLASGRDLYEVVLAHLVTGDLRIPPLSAQKPRHSDASVHR